MKIWSTITLIIILNFTALPSIAAIFKWNLVKTNVVVNEEETHSHYTSFFSTVEKALPKTLNINDFFKFFEIFSTCSTFLHRNEGGITCPHIFIFSPPPEV